MHTSCLASGRPSVVAGQRLAGSKLLRPGTHSRRSAVQSRAFFDKIFKQDPSDKTRKQYQDRVDAINALEPQMQNLSDDRLRAKTAEFKKRVQRGESLESLLPEAFAVSTAAAAAAASMLRQQLALQQ